MREVGPMMQDNQSMAEKESSIEADNQQRGGAKKSMENQKGLCFIFRSPTAGKESA